MTGQLGQCFTYCPGTPHHFMVTVSGGIMFHPKLLSKINNIMKSGFIEIWICQSCILLTLSADLV